jgi:hypothetical protein
MQARFVEYVAAAAAAAQSESALLPDGLQESSSSVS